MPTSDGSRRNHRYLAVGVGVPAIATLVAIVVQLTSTTALSSQIPIHWNLSGDPDRWAPAWTMTVATVLSGVMTAGLAAVNYVPLRDGGAGRTFRRVASAAAGLAVGLAVLLTGTIVSVGSPMAALAVAVAAGAVISAIGWAVQPGLDDDPATRRVAPLTVADSDRVVWMHTQGAGRGVRAVAWISVAAVLVTAAYGWLGGLSVTSAVVSTIVAVVVAVVVTGSLWFHVRVDRTGLTVRSVAGLPRWTVPADEITDVTVTTVNALGDFGGYGIRLAGGRTGVILRSGEAIEVHRDGRRPFVVTLDDAATAAAVLASTGTPPGQR